MAKSNINVNRSVLDPFYRYKMPKIIAKVEGKGNGIKTVIANMTDIAKALARPPTYPTKFFGCELGAQTNFDLKNDRYIVNGEHDANKLQDILDVFIRKFVLCPSCDNPETTLTVKRGGISGKCKACGHSFVIDPKAKLSTFILKNPPPVEGSEAEHKEKYDGGSPDNGLCGEDSILQDGNGKIDEDDEDWAPEPVETQEKLSSQIGKLIIDKDLDKSVDERLDMLHQYFTKAKENGTLQDSKAIVNEAERLELKTKAPLLLADVIFDTDVLNQIKQHRNLLLRFCLNDKKAQRHLLGGIEQVVYANKAVLLPKTAHIIKVLYDADVCEEEVILAWGAKPSSKYVKKEFSKEMIKMAQSVLNWLEQAEEASESEDDEVEFNDRSRAVGTVIANSAENGKKAAVKDEANNEESDEDDVDIDDI